LEAAGEGCGRNNNLLTGGVTQNLIRGRAPPYAPPLTRPRGGPDRGPPRARPHVPRPRGEPERGHPSWRLPQMCRCRRLRLPHAQGFRLRLRGMWTAVVPVGRTLRRLRRGGGDRGAAPGAVTPPLRLAFRRPADRAGLR